MRQLLLQAIYTLRGIPQDGGDQIRRRLPPKRPLSGSHFEERHSQGEDVGALIHRLALDLLRGHVGNRAENRSFPGDPLGGNLGTVLSREFGSQLRQAEVENLDPALRGDHHIAGLQIPVNDSLRMRCRKGIRDGDT